MKQILKFLVGAVGGFLVISAIKDIIQINPVVSIVIGVGLIYLAVRM